MKSDLVCAALALLLAAGGADAAPASSVTGAEITGTQSLGDFAGVKYRRVWGQLHGIAGPDEKIAGFADLPKDATGAFAWSAEFEVMAPAAAAADATIFVEAENRGNPIFLHSLNNAFISGPPSEASYPSSADKGFLFDHGISYARVQWQAGIAAGVPDQAQGIGEVIMRDFGRWLEGGASKPAAAGLDLTPYKIRLLGGISQSAWFVNTFIAEGFNTDPVSGGAVYGGAIAIDGTGNWMAINQLADQNGFPQTPYVNKAAHPLPPQKLLSRPKSDPFYIDIANYNDFYRVHASASRQDGFPAMMRRYDWPSPHVIGSAAVAARLFGGKGTLPRCNLGKPVPLDPIAYDPYARALVLELADQLGRVAGPGDGSLPPTTLFTLGPPPSDPAQFNGLPGMALQVPALDADGQPIGGVRFPETDHPIGKPGVPLPHLGLDSISDTCGNALEWEAYPAEELTRRYGSEDGYVQQYQAALDRLIAAGYVLAADKAAMLSRAAALYRNPAGY